jgi:hypothetical protein
MTDTVWDVVFRAVVRQHQHPNENGAGMIGKAAAVIKALELDADQLWKPDGRILRRVKRSE